MSIQKSDRGFFPGEKGETVLMPFSQYGRGRQRMSGSQAQQGMEARNTCSRSPSRGVLSSFFPSLLCCEMRLPSGNDLFPSSPSSAERRWKPAYKRLFQHPMLFALQASINTSEASLHHMVYKPRARDNPCPEEFTLQTEQANTRKEGGVIITPSVTRKKNLWSGKTTL